MLKFKKQYENQTVCTASGVLVTKENIERDWVQKELKGLQSIANLFEEIPDDPKEKPAKKPVKRTRRKKANEPKE